MQEHLYALWTNFAQGQSTFGLCLAQIFDPHSRMHSFTCLQSALLCDTDSLFIYKKGTPLVKLIYISYKFRIFFLSMALLWCHKGWNSLYGHFKEERAHTHQPEREQEHAHQHASFVNSLAIVKLSQSFSLFYLCRNHSLQTITT